ncbi:heterokaryon incompatibility protein-domain-containing protein, partial [Microdochium trichocladiopsis]
MWLINTQTLKLEWVTDPKSKRYAILSHTWTESQEVTFNEFRTGACDKDSTGYKKIQQACRLARRRKEPLQYCWVDTCCIDKSSSAELSEAINSMYAWYQNAAICLAYLEDMPPGTWRPDGDGNGDSADGSYGDPDRLTSQLEKCRWFHRGWTLQEFIAPKRVEFYNSEWVNCGTKRGHCHVLKAVTGVPFRVLRGQRPATSYPVCYRMSWAANRETTREEDVAYCLLGLFDINMPLLYGEGRKAFRRLQEEIIRQYHDPTLFLWRAKDAEEEKYRGLLAHSPSEF